MMRQMDTTTAEQYIGKRCKVFLKNNNLYNCTITSVANDTLTFIDKFGSKVSVTLDVVAMIIDMTEGQDDTERKNSL